MERDRPDRDDPPCTEAVANLRALAWSLSRVLAAVGGLLALGAFVGLTRTAAAPGAFASAWEPIKPNGALGIVLGSAALLAVERPGAHPLRLRRLFARAATAVVLAFGLATLTEYVFSRDLGLDELVLRLPPSVHASPRMSPEGSVALSCFAAALLLRDTRAEGLRTFAYLCALAAAAIPLVAVVGYAYGAHELYQVANYAPFALPGAIALALLGLGLLFARPNRCLIELGAAAAAGGRAERRLLPAAVFAPCLLGWLTLRGEILGLYGASTGMAIFALAMMVGVVWGLHQNAVKRCRWEQALLDAERRRQSILDTAAEGIITADERGLVDSFNPAAERLFGYRAEEVIGHNLSMLMPDPIRAEHDGYLDRHLRTGERRMIGIGRDVEGRRQDGTTVPLHLSVGEAVVGGHHAYTAVVSDMTDRRAAQVEREMILESERAARCVAERAARMKDEFVATVSHELRTPLNAVLGWAVLLRQGRLDDAGRVRALDVIERNARAQTRMIDDLLDVSRVASGKLKIDAQRIALTEIVQSAVTAAQPAALARGIALESEVSAERCTVRGDPARLHQVVDNLLANALKFTAKGGRVRVTLGCRESSVELRVSDTGIGIRPELVDAIFDRFRQADSSTTRRHGGLGLGLALVKHIVELHGGCVGAESAGEARGATFTVSLPAASSEDRAGANGSSPAEPPSVSGLHVLIVDDEPEVRELLRHALEEDAAIVHDAASAPDALAEIERFHPDVLVSDIGMPVEDGYQLIQSIRGLPPERGGRTPAVALTAFARPEDCARALRSGFQVHLAKPVEPSKLLEVVARLGRVGIAPQP